MKKIIHSLPPVILFLSWTALVALFFIEVAKIGHLGQ